MSIVNIKSIPIEHSSLSASAKYYLNGGARREQVTQLTDYRTPFYALKASDKGNYSARSRITGVKGFRPTDRIQIAQNCLSAIRHAIEQNPDYLAGEEKFLAYACSPRSVRLGFNEVKKNAIDPYYINASKHFDKEVQVALEKALIDGESELRTRIPRESLRPWELEKAMEKLPSTTNGGAPYFETGKIIRIKDKNKNPQDPANQEIEDNRPKYLKIAEDYLKNGHIDREQNAFGSIGRGQETNDCKNRIEGVVVSKQRKPWAEGHAWTLIGALLYPYLIKRADFPVRAALVNQLEVDRTIASIGTKNDWDGVVSGDGSAFDTHMIPWLGKKIGKIILDSFKLTDKQRIALEGYFDHMFFDPLITPTGILVGQHGMPSGTTFTNELDSNYNEVLCLAIKHLTNNEVELNMIAAQGDDAVMTMVVHSPAMKKALDTEEKVKEGLSKIYERLHMDVNPKKNTVSKHKCEFLKRLHIRGVTESYRSYVGSVIGMCNMERAKDGKYPMYVSRGIMQMANHYETLPGFNEFMKFCVAGDIETGMGTKVEGGPKAIFQMAGGAEKVIKRLGFSGYTTHLGVDVKQGEAQLSSTLSSVRGLENYMKHSKKVNT